MFLQWSELSKHSFKCAIYWCDEKTAIIDTIAYAAIDIIDLFLWGTFHWVILFFRQAS